MAEWEIEIRRFKSLREDLTCVAVAAPSPEVLSAINLALWRLTMWARGEGVGGKLCAQIEKEDR